MGVYIPMANQRKKDKKLLGFWATEAEKKALQEEAARRGYSNLAEFLRAIAKGVVKLITLLGVIYWLLGEDPVEGVFLGLEIAGTAAYYLATAAVYAVGFAVEVFV